MNTKDLAPVLASPVLAAPAMAAPVLAAPMVAAPVLAAPVLAAPVLAAPVLAAPAVTHLFSRDQLPSITLKIPKFPLNKLPKAEEISLRWIYDRANSSLGVFIAYF